MKASKLVAQIQACIENFGDFDVIAPRDSEGNGFNNICGVDFIFQSIDDPDCVYDEECEAQDECGDAYECKLLVYV